MSETNPTTTTTVVAQTTGPAGDTPPVMFDMQGADAVELSRYRFRRWLFVVFVTIAAMTGMFLLAFFRQTDNAATAINGFTGIAETVLVTYLGASVLDRSNLLNSIGERMKFGKQS